MDYILLQRDLDSICAWVDQNLLLLNTLKRCYQLFVKEHVGPYQKPCQYQRRLGVSQFYYRGIVKSWEKDSKAAVVDFPCHGRSPIARQKLDSAHTGG